MKLPFRRILTQFSFELELTEDQEEIEVLDLLRRDFLLRADFYTASRDLFSYEVTFDSRLLVPYSDIFSGRMSAAELVNLDRDSPCTWSSQPLQPQRRSWRE